MWVLVALFCVVCSTQAKHLTQDFRFVNLHAKLDGHLPVVDSKLNLVDKFVTNVAKQYFKKKLSKLTYFTTQNYGLVPIRMPGLNLTQPVNVTNLQILGLGSLRLGNLVCHTAQHRVDFIVNSPFLIFEATFNNMAIKLDETFGDDILYTDFSFLIRLMDVNFHASIRYNTGQPPEAFYIDRAEVDLNVENIQIEIDIIYGLEEVRYVLADIFNHPQDELLGVLFYHIVGVINKNLIDSVKTTDITNYMIKKKPRHSKKISTDLLVIKPVDIIV